MMQTTPKTDSATRLDEAHQILAIVQAHARGISNADTNIRLAKKLVPLMNESAESASTDDIVRLHVRDIANAALLIWEQATLERQRSERYREALETCYSAASRSPIGEVITVVLHTASKALSQASDMKGER